MDNNPIFFTTEKSLKDIIQSHHNEYLKRYKKESITTKKNYSV
jgi:hypothetical protein